MKNVALKTITRDGVTIKYLDQIRELMGTPMDARSADLNEVRKSLRVLDAVEKTDPEADALVLEDADFEHFKQRVNAARWPIISKVVVEFVDDVTRGE